MKRFALVLLLAIAATSLIAAQDIKLERVNTVHVVDRLMNDISPAALAKTPKGREYRDALRGFVAAMSASLDGPGPGVRRPNPGMTKPPKAEKGDRAAKDTDGPTKDPATCPHPKDRENVRPYGTFCLDCGKRVR